MAIVVTGGAGFIGSHLAQRLLDRGGAEVVCWDDFNNYYDPRRKRRNILPMLGREGFHLVEGSFTDPHMVRQVFERFTVDAIVHLGGHAGVTPSLSSPEIYAETNILGTTRLLEAMRQRGGKRFVFGSSSTVYGRGATAPFCEDALLGSPLSPYGASKQAAEMQCRLFHELFQVPTVVLRLFNVYGPRLRPDLSLAIFTKSILQGFRLPLFGDGTVRRDFTHVSDVCTAILAGLELPDAVGQTFNIGHDEPVEIREVIRLIEQSAGKTANIETCPARKEDMPFTHANISHARKLLNYAPQVSLADGVSDYVKWFKKEFGE